MSNPDRSAEPLEWQNRNTWVKLLREVGRLATALGDPDEWEEADDSTLNAEFDPWDVLRKAVKRIASLEGKLADARAATEPTREEAWRCFHCDETFVTADAARVHFGADEGSEAACRIAAREGGLVASIRELEERNRELLQRAQEAEYDAEGYSGLRADLKRYFGHDTAWLCWNKMDEKHGEVLALAESVAALRQSLASAERDTVLLNRLYLMPDPPLTGREILENMAHVEEAKARVDAALSPSPSEPAQ